MNEYVLSAKKPQGLLQASQRDGCRLLLHGHPRDLEDGAVPLRPADLARCDRRVLGNTALLYYWKSPDR